MSTKPNRGWTADSHEALLLALIDEVKPNKGLITNVTENMRDRGYTYSYDAINQHVQKLRRNRDLKGVEGATTPEGAATPTPKKAAAPRKRATPAKKAAKTASSLEEDTKSLKREIDSDAEDEEVATPPAKRAKSAPKSTSVADEDEDEDDDENNEA
ncbi:hypothetical protein G7046_g4429 [Stylonectria norvegica]|nr:hypothetical protein G7046_g4429 [Stylonectria norvegica]